MSMCTNFSTFSTRMVAAFFKLLCHVNLSVIAGGQCPIHESTANEATHDLGGYRD